MAERWSHQQNSPVQIPRHLKDRQLWHRSTDSLPPVSNNLEQDTTRSPLPLSVRFSSTPQVEGEPVTQPHAITNPSTHSLPLASSDMHACCTDTECGPQCQQSKLEASSPVVNSSKSPQGRGKRLNDAMHNRHQKGAKNRKKAAKSQVLKATKPHERPGRQFEFAWRIGQAPPPAVRLNQADRCFQQAFAITSQYYDGNSETSWKKMQPHDARRFNYDQSSVSFFCSIVALAGLLGSGLTAQAHQTMEAIRPLATSVLLAQHPMSYAFIVDMAMETSTDGLAQIRAALGKGLSNMASQALGLKHPMSLIFKLPLTDHQKKILRAQLQSTIQQELALVFSAHSYHLTIHYGYWCRVLTKCGRAEEAILMLNRLIPSLEQSWGMNTSLPILAILEVARTELLLGTSSVKLECMLADCLRRLDLLLQNTQKDREANREEIYQAEAQVPLESLLFIRLSALRMLGRVWVMRGNLSAALAYFEHAVAIAAPVLRPDGVTMRICRADVSITKTIQMEWERDGTSSADPVSRLPDLQTITHFLLFDF